jgi:hypothetical protein
VTRTWDTADLDTIGDADELVAKQVFRGTEGK